MKARDVMTTGVVTVTPAMTVKDVANILLNHHISGVPVVDDGGAILGMVSEGDLMRRAEIGTERGRSSWWLWILGEPANLAKDYTKSHATHVRDVMTTDVVSVAPDAELAEVAEILESRHIKRVPVVDKKKLVGIVSRANILRALASTRGAPMPAVSRADDAIRKEILETYEAAPWGNTWSTNVTVQDGVVELWGTVASTEERKASVVAAENVGGVKEVRDRRGARPMVSYGL